MNRLPSESYNIYSIFPKYVQSKRCNFNSEEGSVPNKGTFFFVIPIKGGGGGPGFC